jgi:hypothetical protein
MSKKLLTYFLIYVIFILVRFYSGLFGAFIADNCRNDLLRCTPFFLFYMSVNMPNLLTIWYKIVEDPGYKGVLMALMVYVSMVFFDVALYNLGHMKETTKKHRGTVEVSSSLPVVRGEAGDPKAEKDPMRERYLF